MRENFAFVRPVARLSCIGGNQKFEGGVINDLQTLVRKTQNLAYK